MTKSLTEIMSGLPAERKARVEARAAELIAEEMTLRDLRKARELTQKHAAELLEINQETVSRLERRSDVLLSTLRGYVEAMGDSLELIATFPDRPPVPLSGIRELCQESSKKATS